MATAVVTSSASDPGDTASPDESVAQHDAVSAEEVEFSEDELGLVDGDEATSPQEAEAVEEYLDTLPADAVLTEAEDLEVATVEMPEGVEGTLVVPADIETTSTKLLLDTEAGEISSAVEWSPDAAAPVTTGPGMGTWQDWDDLPRYRLTLNLYADRGDWNDYLGRAEFETATRRLLNDGSNGPKGYDRRQIRRWGQAIPQQWDDGTWLADSDMRVQKLWMSNEPTIGSAALGWHIEGEGGTYPTSNEKICSEKGSFQVGIGAGSFSLPIDDCANFEVWRGPEATDAGHYRISYEQDSSPDKGHRELGYMAGYELPDGASGANTYYEFVTLSIDGLLFYKCPSNSKGAGRDTRVEDCWWGGDSGSGTPVAAPLVSIRGDAGGWHAYDTGFTGSREHLITSATVQGSERTYVNDGGMLYEVHKDQAGVWHRLSTGVYVGVGSPISATYVNGNWARIYVNINGALHEVSAGSAGGWALGDTGVRIGAGSPISATYVNGGWGRIYVNINGALHEVSAGSAGGWALGDTGIRIGAGASIAATYVSGTWASVASS